MNDTCIIASETIQHPTNNEYRSSRQHKPQNTMPQSRAAAEKEVASWGFSHIFTWSDGP